MVAAAEAVPLDLAGRVDELTIQFPWASLLRGTLARDDAVARGIVTLLAPDGRVTALVAPAPGDNLALPTAADLLTDHTELVQGWRCHGLTVTELRAATAEEVRASGSSWAKRLRYRTAVRFTLDRARTADAIPWRRPSGR